VAAGWNRPLHPQRYADRHRLRPLQSPAPERERTRCRTLPRRDQGRRRGAGPEVPAATRALQASSNPS
jgi:hypothetical protein